MTNIEKLTAWHKAQVGTRESGVNRVRYNAVYYGRDVEGGNYDWCAAYVWVGFYETGLGAAFLGGGKSAYCPYVMDWAKAHGRWVVGDYREGDLLLYDWGADGVPDHIGYCLDWDGTAAVAIEGNAGDQVMQVRRPKGQILGAYRPEYGDDDKESDPTEAMTAPPKENRYTVCPGDSWWSIADRELGNSGLMHQLAELNGKTINSTLHPGDVLKLWDDDCESCKVDLPAAYPSPMDPLVCTMRELAKKTVELLGGTVEWDY